MSKEILEYTFFLLGSIVFGIIILVFGIHLLYSMGMGAFTLWKKITKHVTSRKKRIREKRITAELKKLKNGIVLCEYNPYNDRDYVLDRYAIFIIDLCTDYEADNNTYLLNCWQRNQDFIILSEEEKRRIMCQTFVFPRLNKNNSTLSYEFRSYDFKTHVERVFEYIENPNSSENYQLILAQQIAPFIKEKFKIEIDLLELYHRHEKVSDSQKLVDELVEASPQYSIHTTKTSRDETNLKNIKTCIEQAEELCEKYTRLITKTLIGCKVAKANSKHLLESNVSVDELCKQIQEEYKNMQDGIITYDKQLYLIRK